MAKPLMMRILEQIKKQNNFIDVTISTNFTNTNANTYNDIPFDTEINKRGNQISLENGKIKIGKDIDYVEVSGKIQISSIGNAVGGKNLVIAINNVYKDRLMYYTDNSRNIDKSFTSKPLSVVEGDIISVKYYGAQGDVISSGEIFTHLYVKAI